MGRFLVGNIMREVRNGRLNCNHADHEQHKKSNQNVTYVKKIRRGNEIFPYASTQNQKKVIKNYAASQGMKVSSVMLVNSKEAKSDGDPYNNYDEDVMGFMAAGKVKLTQEEYDLLDNDQKARFKKSKGKYEEKENTTKKRRANLMMSPLQAIKSVRITEDFGVRETNKTNLLYTKEVYSSYMSGGFCMDVDGIGTYKVSTVAEAYRDYDPKEIDTDSGIIKLDEEERLRRIQITLDGLRVFNSNITMSNNLEDLSAKFIIMAEYSIGNAVFNNIFEDGKLKIEYLKEAIDENELYRLSNIYIGVRSEFFEQDGRYLIDIIQDEFGGDERFIIGGVKEVMDRYIVDMQ